MTTPLRTTIPIPTADDVALWSRQMVEMQQMLLNQTHSAPQEQTPAQVENDDDDDLWDNLPV